MYFLTVFITFLLIGLFWINNINSECLNGCSSRGLCIEDNCVCAEGLSGPDCSTTLPSILPTLYECPSCYIVTVGPPRYYSGPSWRIPDTPIVGLNFKGTLKVFQGNGNAELVSEGTEVDDWLPAPHEALTGGGEGSMDSCGAWLMRAFTTENGTVQGFYHAETACDYNNNHQTLKTGAYSESLDGGNTFTKPHYPDNRLITTSSPFIPGRPSGEGDYSVVLRGDFYYLFFANVDEYFTGVARAPKSSGAVPGSFNKYYEGSWDSPAVGGKSTGLKNIGGPQAYLHTPSQSFVAVGNFNPYWDNGFLMSASDDAVNWKYFGDPISTPDPVTNNDQFMYPSFMGRTGGYDIGNSFQYFYLWVPPGGSWTFRYQIVKDITLTYVGNNSTEPSTKVALSTYRSETTGETWQSTELAFSPYKPVSILGYLMTRPYPNTFPIYDCFNYTTNDHFIGTATDCFHSSFGVEAYRVLGHIWSARTPHSLAVYRCHATNDYFLSRDPNCEGRAPSQSTPFGYVMGGPDLTQAAKGYDVLLPEGSSWKFYNGSNINEKWYEKDFDASQWPAGLTPFGATYSSEIVKSFFGRTNYYFRSNFTVPADRTLTRLLVSLASDNWAKVYINGFLVDSDPLRWHEAAYWNRRIIVNTSVLMEGSNQISVVTYNEDEWAYFDLEVSAKYADVSFKPTRAECGTPCAHGECVHGKCMCDYGWGGVDCNTYLCSYSETTSKVIIPQGSAFRYTAWRYVPSTPVGWFAPEFDDAWWHLSSAPFGTNSYNNVATVVGGDRHLYRKKFVIEVPAGQTIASASLSIASDDTHRIYINGKFVGTPILPYAPHSAQQWNEVLNVSGTVFVDGVNLIAVEIPRADWRWTQYFDMQLEVSFSTRTCSPSLSFPTSSPSLSFPTSSPSLSFPTSSPSLSPEVNSDTNPLPTLFPSLPPSSSPPSPPSSSPFLQVFYGSNAWWVSMSVVNSSEVVTAMEIKDGGEVSSYTPMFSTPEETFLYIPLSSALVLPLSIRATTPNSSLFFIVDSFYPIM